jgi:hypothetical protein
VDGIILPKYIGLKIIGNGFLYGFTILQLLGRKAGGGLGRIEITVNGLLIDVVPWGEITVINKYSMEF